MKMIHVILYASIFHLLTSQASTGDTVPEVLAYVGDSVTLRSGFSDLPGSSSIDWSIFTNVTWIATYSSGRERVDRFAQFLGRLELDTTSADLRIKNLTERDSLVYTVEVQVPDQKDQKNRIRLTVRQKPEKPIILDLFSAWKDGYCGIALQCSSPVDGATVSWQPESSLHVYLQERRDDISYLFASFAQNGSAVFTCIDSNNFTSKVERRCQDEQPAVTCEGHRHHFFFLLAVFLFAATLVCHAALH